MDVYLEVPNEMWGSEDLLSESEETFFKPEELTFSSAKIPDTAKMRGLLNAEIPAGGKIVVSLANHKYSLRHTTDKKNKNGKKEYMVLCEHLVFDEGSPSDVANGTVIETMDIKDGVAHIEVLTRDGRRRRKDAKIKTSRKIKSRKTTTRMVEIMIENVDRGPSGFWVDEGSGCGNPDIFPEFARGLKSGDYIHKEHDCCPWDKRVMYGSDECGYIGCARHCGIYDAMYLSPDMTRVILARFLENLQAGVYEDTKTIPPLLTEEEQEYIELAKKKEEEERQLRWERERKERTQKASGLISRTKDEEWKRLLKDCYGLNSIVSFGHGVVDFSPERQKDVKGIGNLSYDKFLEAQYNGLGECRHDFLRVWVDHAFADYKGQITNKKNGKICFKRIYINGMYMDGEGFEGKEDHVWMDIQGFEELEVGDCVEFEAEIYRYIKHKDGLKLNYGLCNPYAITKIESYELPSDDDLLKQSIDRLICDDMCMFRDHCFMGNCIANAEWRREMRQTLYAQAKLRRERGGEINE